MPICCPLLLCRLLAPHHPPVYPEEEEDELQLPVAGMRTQRTRADRYLGELKQSLDNHLLSQESRSGDEKPVEPSPMQLRGWVKGGRGHEEGRKRASGHARNPS